MMKRKIILSVSILCLVLLDQLVKAFIVANISLGQVQSFIPGLLSLTYLQNTGAAFSMLENQQWFFALVTFIIIGGAIWYLAKNLKASLWLLTSLVFIIAGGLGNFIDRIHQGFVVDMFQLDFVNFAIFNVADSYVTVGGLLFLIVMMKEENHGSKS